MVSGLLPDASGADGDGVALAQQAAEVGAGGVAHAEQQQQLAQQRDAEEHGRPCVAQPEVAERRVVAEAEHGETEDRDGEGAVRRAAADPLQRPRGQPVGIVEDHLAREAEDPERPPHGHLERAGHPLRAPLGAAVRRAARQQEEGEVREEYAEEHHGETDLPGEVASSEARSLTSLSLRYTEGKQPTKEPSLLERCMRY